MKTLIDLCDQKIRSEFEHNIEMVINEMNATRRADPENALIYLIDAAHCIAELQQIALLGTDLKLHDTK